jgi:hypothetical protein
MNWFDIIKKVNEAELLATLRGENNSPKPPPKPDMNAKPIPSAPDLEMEQIKAKLKEAQQSNNQRNIKIYTNKLNALMDKKLSATAPPIPKSGNVVRRMERTQYGRQEPLEVRQKTAWKNVLKPNPQALEEAKEVAQRNTNQSNSPPSIPKKLIHERPNHISEYKWNKMQNAKRQREKSIYG